MLIVSLAAMVMVAFASWKLFIKRTRARRKLFMNSRYGKGSLPLTPEYYQGPICRNWIAYQDCGSIFYKGCSHDSCRAILTKTIEILNHCRVVGAFGQFDED